MRLLALVLVFALFGCTAQKQIESSVNQTLQTLTPTAHVLVPAPCAWIVQEGYLPDPKCSPGDVLTTDTSIICVTGYTKTVRNVTEKKKNEVYAAYGVASRTTGEYEMDHIIPLELGGSNDVKNLYPEPAEPRPGFHEKDKVENWLHDQVCEHGMNISRAQEMIARNWTEALEMMK